MNIETWLVIGGCCVMTALLVFAVAPCMLSSQISRHEERNQE